MGHAAAGETISLDGIWSVRLDPQRHGIDQRWFTAALPVGPADQRAECRLPGSTDQFRLGTPNRAKPNLDRLYRLISYEGPAWYQRRVEMPKTWQGKRILLFIERTHGESRVWIDNKEFGTQNSFIAPHLYDLGTSLPPGEHRLTVCIDNTRTLNLGWFPSIRYEGTQTNWNGLIRRIELQATDPIAIDDVQVYPNVLWRSARVRISIFNTTGQPAEGTLSLAAIERSSGKKAAERGHATAPPSTTQSRSTSRFEGCRSGGEFSPALYDLTVSLKADKPVVSTDQRTVSFGMRTYRPRLSL